MTQWKSASVGRSSGRSGTWPSGRVEHAVPRHCAPGWQQQAGAGERHRRRQRALRLRSGNRARSTDLYPRHTAACADSLDNAQVVVSDIACDVRRRQRGWSSGQSAERASANSTVSAGTAPAVTVSVRRRHELLLKVCTSVRSDGGGGRQRQEGKGRSDAERLLARRMLRRV